MKDAWYRVKAKLLTIFGDIKYSKYPPLLYYCPVTFKVSGSLTRETMLLLKPGDLVLRGNNCYLDSLFIPGAYSHTGIYTGGGSIIHAVAEGVVECDVIDFLRCDRFIVLRPNSGTDYAVSLAKSYLKSQTPYDFSFQREHPIRDDRLYCHELGAACYPDFNVKRLVPRFFGLIKGRPAFLAESFTLNPNFSCVSRFA